MRCVVLLAWAVLLAAPALAGDGEQRRLEQELEQLASKGAWAGVEQAFQGLEAPGVRQLELAAQAARARGDVDRVVQRLEAARALGGSPEVEAWLEALGRDFGRVSLVGDTALPEVVPFNPDHGAAIAHAKEVLADTGRFEGWLPAGRYVAGTWVEVTPGSAVKGGSKRAPRAVSGGGGNPARAALWTVSGVSVAAAAALYGVSAAHRRAFFRTDDVRDLPRLQAETNRFATLSAVTLGVGVGFAIGGAVVRGGR